MVMRMLHDSIAKWSRRASEAFIHSVALSAGTITHGGTMNNRGIEASEFWRKRRMEWSNRFVCLMLAAALFALIFELGMGSLNASPKLFQFFGRICLVIYDLHSDHNYRLRDDMAARIAPQLEEAAKAKNRFMTVRPRQHCTQPHEQGVAQQLMMELYVKRQKTNAMGDELNFVIVGGSSPNAGDVLSEYELQPTVLVERGQIPDSDIERAFVEYVERNVISLIER
jgi:hypothetical protein